MTTLTTVIEDDVESGVLDLFRDELGYETAHGTAIAPDGEYPERENYSQGYLRARLETAIARISANKAIPPAAREEAVRQVTTFQSNHLLSDNHRLHGWLIDGVPVQYASDGGVRDERVQLVDWQEPEKNDFLAVQQFTVIERQQRRPDVVVFVNGLPLGLIELKSPTDDDATVEGAWNQLRTYKDDLPSFLAYNAVLVASDEWEARVGSLTADFDRFSPWRTIDGTDHYPPSRSLIELPIVLKGVFEKARFLDLIRYFTVFEVDGESIVKKVAQYHQFHGMKQALEATVDAATGDGDGRIGVVWHTQGSGKSLSMAFYAGMVMQEPAMENPTLIVLTDRNDLDDQLFGTFAACHGVLRDEPVQAESIGHLKELLASRASGGIVFATIQKFKPEKGEAYPLLSERRNIVFIADEAHRSHNDLLDGFARHIRDALPNASFIGFTGTPIEAADTDTRSVFGEYITVYDIRRAVEDGSTVKIYYETRLAKLDLDDAERPKLDNDFEELTEAEEATDKEKLKGKWAGLAALVGADKRMKLVALDLVTHWEKRLATLEGKGMIVGMSRPICARLYEEIIALRPDWHDDDDDKGVIKVVMSGAASDVAALQPHIRNKKRNRRLAKRMRDASDPLKLVIVRDMWLTGFDAPSMHTMYIDKPMRGHNLMQAIARVNRVFKDKPAGLVVDYLGIGDQMTKAVKNYTETGRTADDIDHLIDEAVRAMKEKHAIVSDMLHGSGWEQYATEPKSKWTGIAANAMEHVLTQEDGEEKFIKDTNDLLKAFAIAATDDRAEALREDIGFFQLIKTGFVRTTIAGKTRKDELDSAIQQLVSKAVVADGVIDIFDAAGIDKPEISILDDDFLAEVKDMKQQHLALEMLRRMLTDEFKKRSRSNVVEARSFADLLDGAMNSYHSKAITMAELLEELVRIAKEYRERQKRGDSLGLGVAELAFYDAVADNENAREVMGDEALASLAREIAETVKGSSSVDWTSKTSVRAAMKMNVKRLLHKRGYPPDPDNYETATATVLQQAERVAAKWSA